MIPHLKLPIGPKDLFVMANANGYICIWKSS